MTCVICRLGQTVPGQTTVVFERDGAVVAIRDVPAQICTNCGEGYTDEAATERLLEMAEQVIQAGVQVSVRAYAA